jgi:hypothetical protein
MACCDLCGAYCDGNILNELHHQDRIPGVKDVCPSCWRWLDRVRRQLLQQVPGQLRAAIWRRMNRRPWWRFWERQPNPPQQDTPEPPAVHNTEKAST